jgi:hypothetical protein
MGTRDDTYAHKDHTFWIYEILKCDDSLRKKDANGGFIDPECADDMNEWLQDKTV